MYYYDFFNLIIFTFNLHIYEKIYAYVHLWPMQQLIIINIIYTLSATRFYYYYYYGMVAVFEIYITICSRHARMYK